MTEEEKKERRYGIREERRYGKFCYDPYLLKNNEQIKAMFDGIVPLRAECMMARNGEVEVDAWCEEFDIIGIGECALEYSFLIEEVVDDNGKIIEYKRTIRKE